MTQQGTTSLLYILNLHSPTLQTVSLLTSSNTTTMPGSRRTRHNRVPRDTNTLRRHALEQIPTPPMTVHQKFKFLEHIAKVFFFILQEFMNNQQHRPPHRNIPDFPEAFHRSLFDLRILTDQFLESSAQENYHLAARILHLMANASTEDEDQLLQFCTPRTTSQISTNRKISYYHTHRMAMAPTSRIITDNGLTSVLYKLSFTSRS